MLCRSACAKTIVMLPATTIDKRSCASIVVDGPLSGRQKAPLGAGAALRAVCGAPREVDVDAIWRGVAPGDRPTK